MPDDRGAETSQTSETVLGSPAPRVPDPDFLKKCAVLLADHRTGTNYMRLLFTKVTGFRGPAEPFIYLENTPDAAARTEARLAHTFEHAISVGAIDARTAFLDPKTAILQFIGHLQQAVPQRPELPGPQPFLLDIKYSQSLRFGASAGLAPELLYHLTMFKMPVIHLIRRDALGQAISWMVAMERHVFFQRPGATVDQSPPTIFLDPRKVVEAATAYQESRRSMQAHLSRLGARVLTVVYEDALDEGMRTQLQRMMRFVDVWADIPPDLEPGSARQDSQRMVANLPEIVDAAMATDPGLVGRRY